MKLAIAAPNKDRSSRSRPGFGLLAEIGYVCETLVRDAAEELAQPGITGGRVDKLAGVVFVFSNPTDVRGWLSVGSPLLALLPQEKREVHRRVVGLSAVDHKAFVANRAHQLELLVDH